MTAPLLALLQLSDSGFPSGSFTHSYGLEQALNQRWLSGADEVEAFVRSVIKQSAATGDARACYAASVASGQFDMTVLKETDVALFRTKAACELREACVQTGRRLIEETLIHIEAPVMRAYAESVAAGNAPGCHPVAFGAIAGALGVEATEAASALLQSNTNALLQAAMRLGRISHRDAQAILHRLRPAVAVQDYSGGPFQAYHPLQEIASMRHQRAEARLFAS
ncbi:MAG TPA: urease accessory UreF family protein [Dehalococcoidia bacterium]|nr:urease accessory UreF family protein [Dehalococcoidia bacterium]